MSFFLADEPPEFIKLQMIAGEIAHLPAQQRRAALADPDA